MAKKSGWLRLIPAIVLLAVMLLLAIPGVRMFAAYRVNARNVYSHPELSGGFCASADWNPYTAGADLHSEKAIRWYNTFVTKTGNTNTRAGDDGRYLSAPELILERPITYYKKEAGLYKPVAEYPAGTRIQLLYFAHNSPSLDIAHGTTSLPTQDAGWRFVTPFAILENGVRQDAALQELGLCYVRLEDLAAVVEQTLDVDLDAWRQCDTLKGVVSADTPREELARRMLLYMDAELYREGVYRSPDLYRPYFDTMNIALLSAGGGMAVLWVILGIRKRKIGT